jgi:aldose 1-epimerase
MSAGIVRIAKGRIEVELLPEIGGRLHRLTVDGKDLLRTPDDPSAHLREPFRWGAYVMAPWCNRIAAAPTPIDGQVVDVLSNFSDGTAIHGQVYAAPWQLRADGTLEIRGGGDGWPWQYQVTMRIAIEEGSLAIDQTVTNLADTPMPAGIGLHPWFRRPLDVRVNAGDVIRSNLDADARVEPVSAAWDLRAIGPMPDDLDAAWHGTSDPAVELRWPDLGVRAMLRSQSEADVWVVAASPSSLDAVAIEPQTHAPHGLHRLLGAGPGGLQLLAPGASLRLAIAMAFAS